MVFLFPEMDCNSSTYASWWGLVAVLLVVVVLGFPVSLVVFAWWRRRKSKDQTIASWLQIVYITYNEQQ